MAEKILTREPGVCQSLTFYMVFNSNSEQEKHAAFLDCRARMAGASSVGPKDPLAEANATFTYRNKPIHPGIIERFETPISALGPSMVVTIDISATDSKNDTFSEKMEIKDGPVDPALHKFSTDSLVAKAVDIVLPRVSTRIFQHVSA